MSNIYINDNLIVRVINTGKDKQKFIQEAIEEKLQKEEVKK